MNEIDILRADYKGPKGWGKSSLENYSLCVIMHLLVSSVQKGNAPGQWVVFIGDTRLGFISTYSHSRRSKYKYTATTVKGQELDSCSTFMGALSQFIYEAGVVMFDKGTNKGDLTEAWFTETGTRVELIGNRMVFDNGRWDDITELDLSIYQAKGWMSIWNPGDKKAPE